MCSFCQVYAEGAVKFAEKAFDMAEIINQVPGFEKGRVQRISATDEVSESLIPQEKAVGNVYVLDQKNPEFEVVLRKATGIINRRFVRALIISGAERLTAKFFKDRPEKGQEWISSRLEGLSRGMGIPIILVDVHEESVELQS